MARVKLSALLFLGMAAAASAQVAVVPAVAPESALSAPEVAAELSAQLAALLSPSPAPAKASTKKAAAAAPAAAVQGEFAAATDSAGVPDAAVSDMFASVDAAAAVAAADAAAAVEASSEDAAAAAAPAAAAPLAAASAPTISPRVSEATRDLDLAASAATAAATVPAEHTAASLVYQDMMDEVEEIKAEALAAIQADEAAADAAAAAANGAETMKTNDASQATKATVAKYQEKVAKSVRAHADVLTLLEAKKPGAEDQWNALTEAINEAAEYEVPGGPAAFAAASPRLAALLAKAEETEKELEAKVNEAKAEGGALNSAEWKASKVDAVVQALDDAKAASAAKQAAAAYEEALADAGVDAGVIQSFAAAANPNSKAPQALPMQEGDLEPIGGGSKLVAPSAGSSSSSSPEAAPLELVAVGARDDNPSKPTVDFLATLPKDVISKWGSDTVAAYLAAVASAAKVPLEDVDITAVSTEADAVDTRVTFANKKDAESWVAKLREGDDASGLGAATAAAGLGTATASDVVALGGGLGKATGETTVEAAPAPASTSSDKAKLSNGAIAGIAVGSAAGVALIAAVVVVLARRR